MIRSLGVPAVIAFLAGATRLSLPAAASVMDAPGTSIDKSVQNSGGASGFSGSIYSLSSSFGETAIGDIGANSIDLSGGFLGGGSGNGVPPHYLSLTSVNGSAQNSSYGVLAAVPVGSSVTVTFDNAMIPTQLSQATQVTLIRDRLGNILRQRLSTSFSYTVNQFQMIASSGSWQSNSVYEIGISTLAIDQDGLPVVSSVTRRFLTLADPSQDNVLTDLASMQTQIRVASGTFSTPYFASVNLDPLNAPQTASPSAIQDANRKAPGPVVSLQEINAFDASNNLLPASFQGGQVRISVPYSDAINPGFVDGFGYTARVKKLGIYVLDTVHNLWVRLPTSSVDTVSKTVNAIVPHFSVYAVVSPQDLGVADAYAYPVPFRPHGPQAGNASGQSGSDASGITFTNLPQQGSVEVYNVLGELIWKADISNLTGSLSWNTQSKTGSLVASGVYLYVIRSPQDTKTGKLAIVR